MARWRGSVSNRLPVSTKMRTNGNPVLAYIKHGVEFKPAPLKTKGAAPDNQPTSAETNSLLF